MQEELLISRLKHRDMESFELTVDTYKNYVGAIIKSRISYSMEPEDIEEAVADVFFALWKQCNKLDAGKGSIKNYLGMIARNIAVNKLRERKNTVPLEDAPELQGSESPELEILQKESMEYIRIVINKLRTPDKEIFMMYHMEGKSISQISRELGFNQNTIKAKLARTRKKLKKQLLEGGFCYES